MRTAIIGVVLVFMAAPVTGQQRLESSYRHQAESGLRGLNRHEITDLEAGNGMGLARAAELNNYPGPRHVLDAITQGKLAASQEQRERIQQIFDTMNTNAVSLGTKILAEEQALETAFRATTMTHTELDSRVARIAMLQGELRSVHLSAHLSTRAMLSDSQIARYNELRGYTTSNEEHSHHKH